MTGRAIALLALLLSGCTAAPGSPTPPAAAKPLVYTYVFASPSGVHRPGEWLSLTWKATPTTEHADAPPRARLCVALAGPYPSVEELKRDPIPSRTCPVTGGRVVVTSATTEADPARPGDITQDLVVPASLALGYYQVISVHVFGPAEPANVASGARIIRIVAP